MQSKSRLKSILLFGDDTRLVETRAWVFESAGYRTCSTLELKTLETIASREQIDLFILCDSLVPKMRHRAIELIDSKWPSAQRLVLTPADALLDLDETTFPAIEGPRKLIETIHNLMTDGAARSLTAK